jgi:hypothetical protein
MATELARFCAFSARGWGHHFRLFSLKTQLKEAADKPDSALFFSGVRKHGFFRALSLILTEISGIASVRSRSVSYCLSSI